MNKGFIATSILVSIVLGIILIGGGVFAVYKVNEVQNLNEQKIKDLEEKLQNVPELVSEQSVIDEVVATTSESTESLEESSGFQTDTQSSVSTVIKREIVYLPENRTSDVVSPPQAQSSNIVSTNSESQAGVQQEYLKISNVDVDIDGYVVNVNWETNKNSDSRLIVDKEDVIVSEAQDSTRHGVRISGLKYSNIYSYEIVAEVDGEKDSYYGNFATERRFKVLFTETADTEDNCLYIAIVDTEGLPLKDEKVEVSGAWFSPSGTRFVSDTLVQSTDTDGLVEYCGPLDEAKVKNVGNGDEYFKGLIP